MSGNAVSGIGRNESILGLERVTELLSLMGDPQDKLHIIHVAGTNGKGSVSAMLSSVLKRSSYRVGSFNSPALTGVRDGFRIDNETVEQGRLDAVLEYIRPIAEGMSDKPTEFEVLAAAAFGLFVCEKCDIAVIECGLGGDGDATNAISSPALSIITNVQLDHTDRLGKTTKEIAAHKAGIIKRGSPVLFGGRDEDAFAVIKKRAEELDARLVRTDLSRLRVINETLEGTDIEFSGMGSFRLGLIGEYQPENAATVLTAVEMLRDEGFVIPDGAVGRGLAEAVWPGRFEIVCRSPLVIYDGAHNPDGVEKAAASIRKLFGGLKPVLLMGVMRDKEYALYPDILKGLASMIFTVRPDSTRALDAETLAECFAGRGFAAKACVNMKEAVEASCIFSQKHGVPIIAMGTLYMYNEFMEAFKSAADKIGKDGRKK